MIWKLLCLPVLILFAVVFIDFSYGLGNVVIILCYNCKTRMGDAMLQ